MTMFYDTTAQDMHENDAFLIAGNKCAVVHISHLDGETRIMFSFLDNPDDGGSFFCRSDTNFRVRPMPHRSTTI